MDDRPLESEDILRRIHETERTSDKLIREAEAEARSIREAARAKAAEIMQAKEQEWAQRREELLARRLEEARLEARRIRDHAREAVRDLESRTGAGIPDVVEQLLKRLLPL